MKTAHCKIPKSFKQFCFLLVCLIIPLGSFSQNIELNTLCGEWKWSDPDTSDQMYIYLKPGTFEIPSSFGGGSEPCLVGVYKYYKNGVCVADYYTELSDSKRSILYPIRVLDNLSLDVMDYSLKNGNGHNKRLMGSSRIEYISDKMIKWIIVDDAHEGLFSDPKMVYHAGTSLPTSIIFTRGE